jgi:type 2 lantibiotic biosynthesis protein LanM
LEATDFHFENLVAAGEHPVLLDLEALFDPRTQGPAVGDAQQLAADAIRHSVLRVGLLPGRNWSARGAAGVDISGLVCLPGQLTPRPVIRWESAGTDEMRLKRKRVEIQHGQNQPTLNGADVNVLDYADAIAAGFEGLYGTLWKHRDDLLSDQGPLAPFAEDDVRVLLRATDTYGQLLSESFHPDVLRDALDRDRLFGELWATVENAPHLSQVIQAEIDDLQNGDIPLFTTRPNSRHLWTCSRKHIAGFFDESAMSLVQKRIQALGEQDRARQLWFISASLATLSKAGEGIRRVAYTSIDAAKPVDRGRLVSAACRVGNRLEELALRSEQDISWIG